MPPVMDVKSTISSYDNPLAPCSHRVAACDAAAPAERDRAPGAAVAMTSAVRGVPLPPPRTEACALRRLVHAQRDEFIVPPLFLLPASEKTFPEKFRNPVPNKRCSFKHETLTSSLPELSCRRRHFKKKNMKSDCSNANTTVLSFPGQKIHRCPLGIF